MIAPMHRFAILSLNLLSFPLLRFAADRTVNTKIVSPRTKNAIPKIVNITLKKNYYFNFLRRILKSAVDFYTFTFYNMA